MSETSSRSSAIAADMRDLKGIVTWVVISNSIESNPNFRVTSRGPFRPR